MTQNSLSESATKATDVTKQAKTPANQNIHSLSFWLTLTFAAVTLGLVAAFGAIVVYVSWQIGLADMQIALLRNIFLWGGGIATLISVLLGVMVARRLTKPIRQLAESLRVQDINYPHWKTIGHSDYREFDQLSDALQTLIQRFGKQYDDLSVNERKFRETFDLVDIGLAHIDNHGRYLLPNRKFCEILGYQAHELIGREFFTFTYPEERQNEVNLLQEVLAGRNEIPKIEKRLVRKNGGIAWVRHSAVVVRDDKGQFLYALAGIEDISQYRTTQDTLKALNVSLKAIVETSPLAIYSATPNGVVTLWNPAAEKIFGVTEEDILGRISPLIPQAPTEKALEIRRRVLAGETVHNYEITLARAAGADIEISVSAAPLRGARQEVLGILVTCSDITDMKRTAFALDQQLHFTQELLEVIPNPIFYKNIAGQYTGVNRAWEEFFSHKRDWFIGKKTSEVLPKDFADVAEREDKEVLNTGELSAVEISVADGKGNIRQVVRHLSRFTSSDGTPQGLIGVLTDITDFKQVEEALRESEGRFKALTESAMDIVTVFDAEGIIRYQSPSVAHLLGYAPEMMVGRSQFEIVHPEDVEHLRTKFFELLEKGQMDKPAEFRVQARDGSWRMLESIGKNCLNLPAVKGIIFNTRDVTEQREIQRRIQHLAFHDALTGLPNRALMQDRVSRAINLAERSAKKLAVMFIDIDNFKNINDTLGHDVGDDLLREVARRLTDSVRTQDTIARQGGDEFIVLLDQLDGHRGATLVAQKILESLREVFVVGGLEQHVSGSVGIALYPEDGRDSQTLLKNADTAMFHGKSLGKNTYQFFTPQMNIAVKRRAVMESSLRAAVKEESFSLVYQPQIDLNTGEIVALEALVRWNSEENGTVMPGEFIPLAEETGLISEIGAWVLFESCRQNCEWVKMGLPLRRMAVNLSARQLGDKGFIDMLERVLKETSLDPAFLELEITETQVMKQGEGSVQLLNEIAQMGVHLSVDDFGTGYSSLSYLKRLPISKLKIDQSFVRDITVDPNDMAIVVAIISMAKSLGLDIIAEGIETAGQLTLLRAKGCSVGQGYYFSVPMSAEDLLPMLKKRSVFEEASILAS